MSTRCHRPQFCKRWHFVAKIKTVCCHGTELQYLRGVHQSKSGTSANPSSPDSSPLYQHTPRNDKILPLQNKKPESNEARLHVKFLHESSDKSENSSTHHVPFGVPPTLPGYPATSATTSSFPESLLGSCTTKVFLDDPSGKLCRPASFGPFVQSSTTASPNR